MTAETYRLTDLLRESARIRDGFESLEQTCELAKEAQALARQSDDELALKLLLIVMKSRYALGQLRDIHPVARPELPDWLERLVAEIEDSVEQVLTGLGKVIETRHPADADRLALQSEWLAASAGSLARFLRIAAKAS